MKQYPVRLAVALALLALGFATPAIAQSQKPNAAPCSDELPKVTPDYQPTLPPCPDKEENEPASPEPATAPSLPHAAPLIDRARVATFQFSEKLPNFICQEFMSRFMRQGRGEKTLQDIVSAEIIYEDGKETYRNVKINNHPTDKPLQETGGSWSTGEFASALLDLLDPATKAHFSSGRASTMSGLSAQVYDFQVEAANSNWRLHVGSQTVAPAYTGTIWIDPNTARVLRVERQARNIPSDFPIDAAESSIDYSFVTIQGKSFLLPVHAESLGCQRGSSLCSHNIIDFRNYHEFKGNIKIIP